MKIILNDKTYPIFLTEGKAAESLKKQLPLDLSLNRSEDHEYYISLKEALDTDGTKKVSFVRGGYLYYFADWKAFSINFEDKDITPYSVYEIGSIGRRICDVLKQESRSIKIRIED